MYFWLLHFYPCNSPVPTFIWPKIISTMVVSMPMKAEVIPMPSVITMKMPLILVSLQLIIALLKYLRKVLCKPAIRTTAVN